MLSIYEQDAQIVIDGHNEKGFSSSVVSRIAQLLQLWVNVPIRMITRFHFDANDYFPLSEQLNKLASAIDAYEISRSDNGA